MRLQRMLIRYAADARHDAAPQRSSTMTLRAFIYAEPMIAYRFTRHANSAIDVDIDD